MTDDSGCHWSMLNELHDFIANLNKNVNYQVWNCENSKG